MNAKKLIVCLLALTMFACQSEVDEMYGYDSVTDSFILVDYYSGVYKFVQVDNQYTIGVVDGLVDIPEDFHAFENEDIHSYYRVELRLTGIKSDNGTTLYQKYTGNSSAYQVKQAGNYKPTSCAVQRVEFFNDYLYYVMY